MKMMRAIRGLVFLAVLLPATQLHAQEKDTPWGAFVGCWEPAADELRITPSITCIIPTAENDFEARVITIAGSEIVRSVTLLANGTRVLMDDDLCTGWEVASFSANGARLYLSGETRCGDAPTVRTSSLYALLPSGTRLVVSGARTEAGERLQTHRFQLMPPSRLSGPLVPDLEKLLAATVEARRAASRPVEVADVIEASTRLHESVAEAWLAEVAVERSARPVELTTGDLRALAAAQVPVEVIDMLVAVAYPTHFRVAISPVGGVVSGPASAGGNSETGWDQAGWARRTMPRGLSASDCASLFNRAAFGSIMGQASLIGENGRLGECYGASAFGPFGPYGMIPFWGFGFGGFMYSGFFAGGAGWNAWNTWNAWGQPHRYRGYFSEDRTVPIQVTVDRVNTGGGRANNGRVVNGTGYTSGDGSTSGRAQPRGSTSAPPRSADQSAAPRSSAGSSSGSSSTGSSSGGSSTSSHGQPTGRTAKPRVP